MNIIHKTIFALKFLNRNSWGCINTALAFLAFAALRPGNAAIGTSSKTSPTRKNFSNCIVLQLLVCCFFIVAAQPALAQNKKETLTKMAIATKVKYSLTNNIEQFNFKAKKAAIYNVLVLSPIADIISKPVNKKQLNIGEELNFNINTKYWKPGTYRILIQIDGNTIEQRKLIIKRQRH